MQDLKIALIQTPLHWQDPGANLSMLEEKIWQLNEEVDLIVLPEMFPTGFTMNSEQCAEPMNFTSFKWMKQMAAQTKAVVTGSIIISENKNYYNRLIWMRPDGTFDTYDKRHLFRMANEHDHYNPGKQRLIVELNDWHICPLICYDLRFPVWSRNQFDEEFDFDLLLYVANWPQPRVTAWDALLKARAIENLCYCMGVNRIGTDGNDVPYNGHSSIYDFKGEALIQPDEEERSVIITLSRQNLMDYRTKFPAHLDADKFSID